MEAFTARTFDEFKNSKDSKKPHYLVVGHPISHSLSPLMHNISIQHYGYDEQYYAIDISPDSMTGFIAWLNREEFRGCNITLPLKQQLLSVPDTLSAEAEAVGAINTIVKSRDNTELSGHNTDTYGFWKPLEEYFDVFEYTRAIIFGSGGASRAVQFALSNAGFSEIIVVSRAPERVELIHSEAFHKAADYSQWQSYAEEAELIINTTPLGMGSNLDKSPVQDSEITLLEGKVCYDLVYNPMETRFLKQAEQAGAARQNGLDMLIHQGSRSFELWTGQPFPFAKVKDELYNYFNI